MAFAARRARGKIGGAGSADSAETAALDSAATSAANDDDDSASDGAGATSASAGTEAEAFGAGQETATELTFTDHTDDSEDVAPRSVGRGRKRLGGGKRGGKRGADKQDAPSAPKRNHHARPKLPAIDQGAVSGLLDIAEGFLVPQLGAVARFQPQERALIVPALAGIIDRMTPEMAERFRGVADPVLLAVGLGMWGLRVYGAKTAPAAPRPRPGVDRPETGSVTVAPAGSGGSPIVARPETVPPAPVVAPSGRNGAGPVLGVADDALHDAWGTAPL